METIFTPSAVEIIQLALAPIFLIMGIGTMVNVATGRVSRIIDRARWFEEAARDDPERINQKARREIQSLNKRLQLANWSINLLLAAAVVTCFTVMVLMLNGLVNTNLHDLIIVTFMLCMMLLTGGLIAFFFEVSLATANLKIKLVDFDRYKPD